MLSIFFMFHSSSYQPLLTPACHDAAPACARLCGVVAAFLLVLFPRAQCSSGEQPQRLLSIGVAADLAGLYSLIGADAIVKCNSTGHLLSSSAVILNETSGTFGLNVDACGQQCVTADDMQSTL